MKADKTVIVTGANSGLGFECAKAIASAACGWHIVLACRDIAKGQDAKQKITAITGSEEISVLKLDLASLNSVQQFVNQFTAIQLAPLRGLINNAGMQVLKGLEYTEDGYDLTFGTNHLGHFLLTQLLLDRFVEPARIIIVSSGTHDPDSIDGKFNKPVYLGVKNWLNPKTMEK